MKPLKATTPVARWFMRITLLIFIYFNYFSTVKAFGYKSPEFYFAAVYFTFSVLLIFGALFSQVTLTIISSIVIFGLSVYLLIKISTSFLYAHTGKY
ncbi:MAG: hypothetical protein HC906_17250 [Bacteroidales bacterium]|nr:hypothetical protein [Bacteroidales bacterium]